MMKKVICIAVIGLFYACGSESKETEEAEVQSKPEVEQTEVPIDTVSELDEGLPEETEVIEDLQPVLCLESEKVDALIKDPDPESEDYDEMSEFQMISEADWNSLSQDEKFVYSFAYPEWFDQVCAESSPYNEDYLFGRLPWDNSGASMSTRQSEFLKKNRAFTMDRIWECVVQQGKVSEAYLRALRDLEGYEMIPSLAQLYAKTENNYILSYFIELMANDDFDPYMEWHKKSDFFESFEAEFTGVELTKDMEVEILQLADNYYAQKMRP
jgi:hypothetical protein